MARSSGGLRPSISATRLAEVGLCQRMVALRLQHGEAPAAPERQLRLDLGVEMHTATEQAAARPRERPCFIASVVFGPMDPRTKILRVWRDEVLMRSNTGRSMVRFYYRVSPAIARRIARSKTATWLVERLLEGFVFCVVRPWLHWTTHR